MMFSIRAAMLPLILGVSFSQAQEPAQDPIRSGIVEKAGRRLMQIDVTVSGSAETIAALSESDFKLTVGREDIDDFVLDRICIDGGGEGLDLTDPAIAEAAPRLRTMLFFDQTHLTSAGRRRSISLARELIPELLASGRSEAMIVSASHRLHVVANWSDDPVELLDALDRLEHNAEQMSTWADLEDSRVERLMSAIDRMTEFTQEAAREYNRTERELTQVALSSGPAIGQSARASARANQQRRQDAEANAAMAQKSARTLARVAARDLSREEASRTSAGLSLFNIALRHLDHPSPPKAVVYFADTMRANAGDFYVSLVTAADRVGAMALDLGPQAAEPVRLTTGNYVSEFQDAIDLATEKGVRFYTVQGRGLVNRSLARSRIGSASTLNSNPLSGRIRFNEAERALGGFARETGGESFLWAADTTQIASRILDDLSCLFVFSFHALDLKEDRRTNVWIEVDRSGLELKYRPKIIALSERKREEGRLANAFWGDASARRDARVTAIPTGFKGGKYTVLVQFAIPGSSHGNDWDMGVTALVGKNRTIDASGRVIINQPGLPLVFEAEMRFKPGDFKISAVAKNNSHGGIISTSFNGSLPDPDDRDPFVASIALVQRVPGAFVRGGATRKAGMLASGVSDWLNPDHVTGILALICGTKRADPVTAERSLKGASTVLFDPVDLDFDQEHCGLMIDAIEGRTLTSGKFSYAVSLTGATGWGVDSTREFLVVTPEEIALARKDGSR